MNMTTIQQPTRAARPGLKSRALGVACALSGALLAPVRLSAAEAPATYDPAFVQEILKRLDAQQAEIQRLNEALKKQGTEIEMVSGGDALTKKEVFPSVTFHGFGDINYQVSNFKTKDNAFVLGEMDLFLQSRLSDKLEFVTEVTVSADDSNTYGIEAERLFLSWHQSEEFNVTLGRFHSDVGYYNTAFHHGTWFQAATGRPTFLNFEDEGGLITSHTVGLSAKGELPSGKWNFGYTVEIGNGRSFNPPGSGRNFVANTFDDNLYKSVNAAVHIKPDWLPGWQFGAGLYHDTINPQGVTIAYPNGVGRTDEFMPHAFAVYKNGDWQFLSEAELWHHQTRGDGSHTSQAAFGQLERRYGKFTPYARFTYQNASANDPLWQFVGLAGLKYGPSVGVRYDFSELVALKVQYDHFLRPGLGDLQQLTLQAAFTF